MNPNVPRKKEKGAPPKFDTIDYLDSETGEVVFQYVAQEVYGIHPGTVLVKKEGASITLPQEAVLFGILSDPDTTQPELRLIVVVNKADDSHFFLTQEEFATYEVKRPPPPETGKPFAYDRQKATDYGFSALEIKGDREAQQIIDAIYARDSRYVTLHKIGSPDPDSTKTPPDILTQDKFKVNEEALKADWTRLCGDLPDTPEKSIWFFQALAEHRLSNTIDGDDSKNLNNPTKPHIPNFGQDSFMLAMDFPEFDYDNATKKATALTPQTKKILHTLFGTEDPTNISREEINTALWIDHETRIQSPQSRVVIRDLLGSGHNPDDYELRLLRYDEYARAASSKNYGQKNLLTHFDGYSAHDGGRRAGLGGGHRDYGGAAVVGGDLRGNRGNDLTVRVVLSRKG